MNAINAISLAGYAVILGAAIVIILSIHDFHRPFRVDDIRYAVMRERYWIVLIAYASIGLFFYVLILYAVSVSLLIAVMDLNEVPGSEYIRPLTLSVSVIASMLVLLVATNTPFVRILFDWLRRILQRVARYPASAEIMTALIARSKFSFVARGDDELRRELATYSLADGLIVAAINPDCKILLPAAVSLLREVCSLHAGVTALRQASHFRCFVAARREVIDQLEKEYRHLLRRAAQSIMLVDDLGASDDASLELALGMSNFIAEETQPVRAGYQRLVAEAAVSRLWGSAARKGFLETFGYDAHFPETLPTMPLVIVFLLPGWWRFFQH
jgi:hypothetical protein